MTESMNKLDLGGVSPTFNTFYLGATKAGAMNGTEVLSTGAELNTLHSVTAGTAAASKALVLDANKKLAWTATDATSQVTPLSLTVTATLIGANVDGAYFTTATEVALGTYANALNGKLNFGTAGRVSGLGAAVCAELDLGPGTTPGSYACFEAELNCPTSGSTGARTSFISMNLWGANAAAVDTAGFLFDIGGLTANTGKLLRTGLSQAVTATARLRVQVNGTTYYIPLCVNEALTS